MGLGLFSIKSVQVYINTIFQQENSPLRVFYKFELQSFTAFNALIKDNPACFKDKFSNFIM